MLDQNNLRIDSAHPCLILFLLDQSGSMNESFANSSHKKSEELATAVNRIIIEIGLRCRVGGSNLKNRFELAVIGYGGDKVRSGWEGALAGRWVQPIDNVFKSVIGVDQNERPYWIKPYAYGETPMTKAFENAKRLCTDWITWGNHVDCHPPILINVTDGEATDAGPNFELLLNEANVIRMLQTRWGSVNIFNMHLSSHPGDEIIFPSTLQNIKNDFARLLFEISTPLSEHMIWKAVNIGIAMENHARGYVFNGSAITLMNFLNIGTRPLFN